MCKDMPNKNKTAMQTLLEDIEFLMPETYEALNKKFELKTFYLQKEKEQIIQAHEKGLSSIEFQTANFKNGSKYYKNIFGDDIIQSKKCKCKKATFTRSVDADFNPLCGKCGNNI